MSAVMPIPAHPRKHLGTLGFLREELRPKGRVLTPFNVITAVLMLATVVILTIRFTYGLGAVTNLSQDVPWGLWKGFNVIAGVALAGGAYMITFLVYILRLETYRPIVRVTVLNGFLAYVFYAGALVLDLGRPWHILNPIIGNSFGMTSILFLVAWHFLLYMLAALVEFSPTIAEWLGAERVRRILTRMTVGAVVLGITLSLLHQSGLGALYLMAKQKLHPLWYTELLPVLFVVSSVFAGLSMVIFEGTLTYRAFFNRMSLKLISAHHDIVVGLARICACAMFAYLFLVALNFLHGQHWRDFSGFHAGWWLFEIVGLVAVPMALFAYGAASRRQRVIQLAAVLALLGVILNRLNVSVIAYRYDAVHHYVPTWMEVVVVLGIVSAEIWVFRWVVNRMAVLGASRETRTSRDASPLRIRSSVA